MIKTSVAEVNKPGHRDAMTDQVLFIQGRGEDTHEEWDNGIRESLERELGPDYAIRYPRMPHEADPKYAAWKAALKRHFVELDEGAILIGHSIGGAILIRTLADDPPNLSVGGVFFIAAPFLETADGTAKICNRSSISAPNCLTRRRSISITAARTVQPHSGMWTCTRTLFREPSSADWPVETISSITICQKLPPISGVFELRAHPIYELFLGSVAGERSKESRCHG